MFGEKNVKRILITNTIGLHYEGMTFVIYNYISKMNRDKLDIVFTANDDIPKELRNSFEKLGKVVIIPYRNVDLIRYIVKMLLLLKNEKFDVIHIHGNSGTMIIEVILAKIMGIKKIITHCHNTTCDHLLFNKIFSVPMKKIATILIACSKASGHWLYGKKDFIVLNNAINIDKFLFSENNRKVIRKEFDIGSEFVIGHVGRFSKQKNHEFLIKVFNEYHNIDKTAKLLLVGKGADLKKIKSRIEQLGIKENVIFAGQREDVEKVYSAMDIFIFPSLWEGLPLVMVEAQANGLPVIASDVITADTKCTPHVLYYSLKLSEKEWALRIEELKNAGISRAQPVIEEITNSGFNIYNECDVLRNIYVS